MGASGMGTGFGEMMVDPDTLVPENITTLTVTVAGNETEVTFPNLIPYTVYSCLASASTSAGEGNFTGETAGRTDESGERIITSCAPPTSIHDQLLS